MALIEFESDSHVAYGASLCGIFSAKNGMLDKDIHGISGATSGVWRDYAGLFMHRSAVRNYLSK